MSVTMMNEDAKGVYNIAPTPFTDLGELDLNSTDSMVDFMLESGVTGITILGVMGEATKLTQEESITFTKRVISRVDGRIPVIVGASGNGLDNQASLTRQVMDFGASGVMIAPLSTLKTETQVIDYFDEVLGELGQDVPVCFQDYPQMTGVTVSVATLNHLISCHSQFVILKHEEFPGLRKISQLRAAERKGQRRISILCGNGGIHLCQELRRGADGAMTGFSFPDALVKICSLFAESKAEEAEDLFDIHLPLLRHEYQPGLGLSVRKEILHRRGAIAFPTVRRPGPKLNSDDIGELNNLLDRREQKMSKLGDIAA